MRSALIIFVRHPVAGKVKTRLAATLGDETAVAIYKKLLQHTFIVSRAVNADKFIFYADEIIEDDLWNCQNYFKLKQQNGNLGDRMKNAFEQIFIKGYNRVCIIGSDCYKLTSAIIDDALSILDNCDIVIGPAQDGGYYLLGMTKFYTELFENKSWSTSRLLQETIESINHLNLSFTNLQVLRDVDEEADVPKAWLSPKK